MAGFCSSMAASIGSLTPWESEKTAIRIKHSLSPRCIYSLQGVERMMDMEKLGAELLAGRQGGAIRDMANSPEAKKLGAAIDPAAAERAVRSGDAAQLKALLSQILSTDEGKALAEKLSRFGNGK